MKNISIFKKINLSFIFLTSILIITSSFLIYKFANNYNDFSQSKTTTKLINEISDIIHELQKERGYSSAFLSNSNSNFGFELEKQKQKTDISKQKLEQITNTLKNDNYNSKVKIKFNIVNSQIDSLKSYRKKVEDRKITSEKGIKFYSKINNGLLQTIEALLLENSDKEIIQFSQSLLFFMKIKEYAGIERAVLSNVFSVDSFGTNYFHKFSKLVSNQNNFEELFFQYANKKQAKKYDEIISNESFLKIKEYRNIAFSKYKTGQFNINPHDWFNSMTTKINLMRDAEISYFSSLKKQANAKKIKSLNYLLLSFLVVLITIVILILTVLTTKKLIKHITKIGVFCSKIASADLTVKYNYKKNDEIGKLYNSINKISQNLREIITNISKISASVFETSKELSYTSGNISERANQQAATTEEVASSMEEMTAIINSNTEIARDTGKITANSANKLEQSNKDFQETVKFVQNISKKTSIISDIAFQTNILALNASIQAAKAGKYGKGFAVVAQEVGDLAEKSKIASEEITELSEQGQKKSQKSAIEQTEIIPEILRSSELVNNIASASQEQQIGIETINNSIQELTEITNENSASAEQMSASASELSAKSEQLKNLISVFKIDNSHQNKYISKENTTGSKKNCWEFFNCGRETGGKNVQELGVCPATKEQKLNNIHGGKNAGRTCWAVAGTFCKGDLQGHYADKMQNCKKCDFYKEVIKEEDNISNPEELLKKIHTNKLIAYKSGDFTYF